MVVQQYCAWSPISRRVRGAGIRTLLDVCRCVAINIDDDCTINDGRENLCIAILINPSKQARHVPRGTHRCSFTMAALRAGPGVFEHLALGAIKCNKQFIFNLKTPKPSWATDQYVSANWSCCIVSSLHCSGSTGLWEVSVDVYIYYICHSASSHFCLVTFTRVMWRPGCEHSQLGKFENGLTMLGHITFTDFLIWFMNTLDLQHMYEDFSDLQVNLHIIEHAYFLLLPQEYSQMLTNFLWLFCCMSLVPHLLVRKADKIFLNSRSILKNNFLEFWKGADNVHQSP